jgi:hypothetical protein
LAGCQTLETIQKAATYETSPQTAEAVLISAEKTTEIAALTFDEFLRQEHKYSDITKAKLPKVHQFAEYLRKPVEYKKETIPTGVMFLKKARAATEAFRVNRTAEGEANLKTAIASVKSLLDQAKSNLEQIPALKGP